LDVTTTGGASLPSNRQVRLYAAVVATRSVAIEGCTVDHVVQTDTAQRLSEFLLGN
jgi:hypothetical protein